MNNKNRIKWNDKNVEYKRGNHRSLICSIDNCPNVWFEFNFNTDVFSAKSCFRNLIHFVNGTECIIKYQYDDDDFLTEPENKTITVVEFDGNYKFRREIPVNDGCVKQFKYFNMIKKQDKIYFE